MLNEHLIPVLLPHLHWQGDALCSMGGVAPLLSPAELAAARLVDGGSSMAVLRGSLVEGALESLIGRSLAVLVDPGPLPKGRRRVCALSPHADDVALSIGGLLDAHRSCWETTLVT